MSILLTHILFLAGLLVPPTEGIPNCSLCMLGSALVAVVVAFVVSLFCNRILFAATSESESPGFVRIAIHSIRPPPPANLFR